MPGCCCTNRHRPSPYAPHLADRGLLQNAPIFYLLRQSNPPLPDNSPESTVPILHLRDISERAYVEVIVSLVNICTRVLQRNQCRGPYHEKAGDNPYPSFHSSLFYVVSNQNQMREEQQAYPVESPSPAPRSEAGAESSEVTLRERFEPSSSSPPAPSIRPT